MAQHRARHRTASGPEPSVLTRRKLQEQVRRALNSRRRVFTISSPYPNSRVSVASSASSPPSSSRPVLVPVHFNLRRLPSRLVLEQNDSMRDAVEVGSKRKRVVSGSENLSGNGRNSRASGNRFKRRKAAHHGSSDEEASAMEVDERGRWELSDDSDDDDGALDSCKSPFIFPPFCFCQYLMYS